MTATPTEGTGREGPGRFLTQRDVQDELAISGSQVYALIRNKQLRAIKIGGRGQWRIARADLEAYLERAYADTEAFIDENPLGRGAGDAEDDDE